MKSLLLHIQNYNLSDDLCELSHWMKFLKQTASSQPPNSVNKTRFILFTCFLGFVLLWSNSSVSLFSFSYFLNLFYIPASWCQKWLNQIGNPPFLFPVHLLCLWFVQLTCCRLNVKSFIPNVFVTHALDLSNTYKVHHVVLHLRHFHWKIFKNSLRAEHFVFYCLSLLYVFIIDVLSSLAQTDCLMLTVKN